MDNKRVNVGFFGVAGGERQLIEKKIFGENNWVVGLYEKNINECMKEAKDCEIISIFVGSVLDKSTLDKLDKLKFIATRSTGLDHIDLEECKKRKIEVTSVPEYGSVTVAEYAFGLLLAVAKKIVVAHQSVEEGDFSSEGLTGIDIENKTLGVIGVGRIGENMVRYGNGFRMRVLGMTRHRDEQKERKLGYEFAGLEKILKESDFISLHVPSTPETFHLINRQNIELMKPGSYLINTSRGDVIEAEAILWALNNKILKGAALDVAEAEKVVSDRDFIDKSTSKDDLKEAVTFHMLRDRDDVIFTPHNAFNTSEAIERIVETTFQNIKEYLKKRY